MINGDLVEGWDGLFLHLTNGKSLNLRELPVVSETEDCCPIFSWCFVDGVELVIEHPEETRKVIHSHAIEDARVCIRTPGPLSCAVAISYELLPKHRGFTLEEKTVHAKKHVLNEENYVAAVDVVLSVPTVSLEAWLVHDEIRPVSTFGEA